MTELADEPSSLLDWVTGLATDPALRARFADEPRSVLDEQGLAGLRPADLHHALPLVSDSVASRLGADVDTAALAATTAQMAGEDPASALARQLGVVTDSVLAGSATAVTSGPGIDDDPVDLDDLDTPDGPADVPDDLDDPDDPDDVDDHQDPDRHHDLDDGGHDLDGSVDGADHPIASVTVLPVPTGDDVHDDVDGVGDVHGLVVGTPAEHLWASEPGGEDGYADPPSPTDDPDPDDPGPHDPGPDDAAWFA